MEKTVPCLFGGKEQSFEGVYSSPRKDRMATCTTSEQGKIGLNPRFIRCPFWLSESNQGDEREPEMGERIDADRRSAGQLHPFQRPGDVTWYCENLHRS